MTHRVSRLLLAFLCLLSLTSAAHAVSTGIVISQVYGGGGGANATAAYSADFVELFNAGSTAVSLNGYSIQYGSSGGTTFSGLTNLNSVTLQPGQFYLVQEGTATSGGALPTPDQTGTINISATAGKIALVNGTATLTSCTASNVVDFIGFGAANCSETAPTAALSIVSSATRTATGLCADTDNNVADFGVVPASARNSTTPFAPCGAVAPPSTFVTIASASVTPTAVNAGTPATLTVVVTPNTSVGITVTADISLIGGSATQALALGGLVNTYTFTATPGAAIAAGTYTIPVVATDGTGNTAKASVALTLNTPTTVAPIAAIQGNRSAYVGNSITTTGVITGVGSAGFFVQTPSSTPGSTGVPEGVYAYTGTGNVPANAIVGNNVNVTGKLSLFPAAAVSHTPALEINTPSITINSTGNPLPPPVVLTAANLTPSGGLYQVIKYESMRVSTASLTTISGTDGFLDEPSETVTSDGSFYAVITGTPPPFREPGIDIRDFASTIDLNVGPYITTGAVTYASKPTLFDDNPERLLVDSDFLGGKAIDLSTGALLANPVGILDLTYSTDSFADPARLLLDPSYSASNVTAGMTIVPVPAAAAGQFTVAAFNIERFFNTNSADDIYYNPGTGKTATSLAVDVTAAAYARRLKKVSLAIRTVLNLPDILTLEEAENVTVAQDIATQINNDTVAAGLPNPGYVGYGVDYNSKTYTNDVGGISVAFLVKSTVNTVSVQQYGTADLVPTGTALNDRPPYVLHAGIKRAGSKDYPITVVGNHLRSLSGIATAATTRLKKELQAEALATLISGFQKNGEHVIAVGDMNAFEFSDAYTDTMATITNTNVLPASVIAQPGVAGLVTPAPVDLVNLLPANQRWSYVEFGSHQVLDHIVATQDLVTAGAYVTYAHFDADFPMIAYNDPTTPARASDHDVPVSYIPIPAPAISATLTGNGAFGNQVVGTTSTGSVFTLTNTGEGLVNIATISTGASDFAQTNNCGTTLAINATCAINVVFKPVAAGPRVSSVSVSYTSITATGLVSKLISVPLTGTGTSPDFTFSTTTPSLTVIAGNTAGAGFVLAPINGFNGSISVTCTSSGTAPAGVTCTPPPALTVSVSTPLNINFSTTARTTTSGFSAAVFSGNSSFLGCTFAGLFGLCMLLAGRTRRAARIAGLFVMIFAITFGITGCAGGGGGQTNPGGTPAGTYTYTVTATSGALTHAQTITLTVQ